MKSVVAAICSLFFVSGTAHAVSILQSVDTKFEDSNFVTSLEFDKPVAAEDALVEYINQTIQVNVPGATVKKGKSTKKVEKNKVKSIFAYQYQKDMMRTRIILDESMDAKNFEGKVRLRADGKKLIVSFPSDTLGLELKRQFEAIPPVDLDAALSNQTEEMNRAVELATQLPGKADRKPTAVDILKTETKKTEVKAGKAESEQTSIKGSVDEVKADKTVKTTKEASAKPVDTEGKSEKEIPVFAASMAGESKEVVKGTSTTRVVLSLVVVLGLAVGLMLFTKWWQKNHKVQGQNTKIQVLTQHHLGPKKNLTIIRVAGESILLGVTDQNISMLKTLSFIDDEIIDEVPEDFGQSLVAAEANTAPVENTKITFSPAQEEELNSITDRVSTKIKQMRSIQS